MMDQCNEIRKRNIPSVCITSDLRPEELEGIRDGMYSLVFLSPEIIVNFNSFWRKTLLESEVYRKNVCLIAVDEAHIVDTWGEDFRPAFSKVGDMRSFFKNAPFLLLSATCGPQMLDSVCKKLHIFHPHIETSSPDRPNIFLSIKSESGMNPSKELSWIIQDLQDKGQEAMKTLLYVRNLTTLGRLYMEISSRLMDGASTQRKKLLTCYHSSLSTKDQSNILGEFKKPNSSIRLLICTVAFGLGVNIPDVRIVIHWGACSSALEYWQEVGRAGRDGKASFAYCYALKRSLNFIAEDMKRIVRAASVGSCIREAVLDSFVSSEERFTAQSTSNCQPCRCSCCSVCKLKCSCKET